jgi:tellurite resistance protein
VPEQTRTASDDLPAVGSGSAAARAEGHPPIVLTPNLFGIPFAVAGVALGWSTAHQLVGAPAWPAVVLWLLAGLVYLVLLVPYLRSVVSTGRVASETADLTFGPFTALVVILPMLGGLAVAAYAPRTGTAVFFAGVVLVAVYGGWLSGQWIVQETPLERWHPGYFLPTVAGPLIASAGCAGLGYSGLARLLFGYGALCWLVLGSIILLRLFTRPLPPTPLIPTLAIELAPPVVAGNAWFAINGNRADTVAYVLAGYAVLMALVQLRLVPLYLRVPFVAGVWAFGFSFAAVIPVSIRWLVAEQVASRQSLTYGMLMLASLGLAALIVRTVLGLVHGTFLPRSPLPLSSGGGP